MVPIIRRGSDTNSRWWCHGPPVPLVEPAAVGVLVDKGLIGFDVGTGSDIVRPELLRLVNRGTNTTAEKQSFALAA